jgi:hypothetical protein
VSGKENAARSGTRPKRKPQQSRARRQLRLVWLVGLVAISIYLYYRPLDSYFATRNDLTAQRAKLAALQVEKSELELQLVSATSVEATRREAR